jgi:hypothetical protein
VLNCGGTTANTEKFIKQFIAVKAVFGIKTADNYVPMFKQVSQDEINAQLDKADANI